jgi:hypothetical protein
MDPMQRESVLAQSLKPNGEERGQIALVVDGKTLRSTILIGETRDMHLLAAYLPAGGGAGSVASRGSHQS